MSNHSTANLLTFQKLWKVQVGQFLEGGFTPLFELTRERFKASIKAEVQSKASGEVPQVSKVRLYNLGYDQIEALSNATNTHIQIDAGYVYQEGSINTVDTLPTIYIGKIIHSRTFQQAADVITEVSCVPNYSASSNARCNKVFRKGASVLSIFRYLASTMSLPLEYNSTKLDNLTLRVNKTVEGASAKKMTEWCDIYKLRWVTERNRILLVDKEVQTKANFDHKIPLSLIKGEAETSIDLRKTLKEGTEPVINFNITTFLYSKIRLGDTVVVETVDYSVPRQVGNKKVIEQGFVVDSYTHVMDSHEGNQWDTVITGKGEQNVKQ